VLIGLLGLVAAIAGVVLFIRIFDLLIANLFNFLDK